MKVSRVFYLLDSIVCGSAPCLLFRGDINVIDLNYPLMSLFNVSFVEETLFCYDLLKALKII